MRNQQKRRKEKRRQPSETHFLFFFAQKLSKVSRTIFLPIRNCSFLEIFLLFSINNNFFKKLNILFIFQREIAKL